MNKVLPNPIALADLVRAAAFQSLFDRREPLQPTALAGDTGIKPATLSGVLAQLSQAGRIRRDGQGRVVGSGGLSVTPDRHSIEIDGSRFWTWCAYDIFGIFGALAASGHALSASPGDRRPIEVRFVRGRPEPIEAVLFRPDMELMKSCDNVYEQWCPNSNLFLTRQLAEAWATANRSHHPDGQHEDQEHHGMEKPSARLTKDVGIPKARRSLAADYRHQRQDQDRGEAKPDQSANGPGTEAGREL